jgi:hypothetical protein
MHVACTVLSCWGIHIQLNLGTLIDHFQVFLDLQENLCCEDRDQESFVFKHGTSKEEAQRQGVGIISVRDPIFVVPVV